MLTAITIENFKGISEPVRLELRPITLLFGQNSAGKSSLLHALIYAREVFERHNLDADRTLCAGDSLDLGGFRALVHGHDLSRSIRFKFELDLSKVDLPTYVVPNPWLAPEQYAMPDVSAQVQNAAVSVEISWHPYRHKAFVSRYAIELNGRLLGAIRFSTSRRGVTLEELDYLHPLLPPDGLADELASMFQVGAGVVDFTRWVITDQSDAMPEWGKPLELTSFVANDFLQRSSSDTDEKMARGVESTIAIMSRLLVGPGELLRDALKEFRYLGPLRQVPPRDYRPPRLPEPARWANGMAGWDLLHRRPRLVARISQLLADKQRLNLGYTLELVEFRALENRDRLLVAMQTNALDDLEDVEGMLRKLPTHTRLLFRPLESPNTLLEPADLGVGVSQMIPCIAAVLDDQPIGAATLAGQLVAIEHPELNLHPRLQAELADVFLEGTLSEATRGRIIFLETHSEVLPLRLFRRVRESTRKKGIDAVDRAGASSGVGDLTITGKC